MITTPRQAVDFVRKHGIVTMTASSKPSLVEAVAGGPVKGSWWGHPKGGIIYRLAESLHDSRDVLSLKLVDGKVTFLHRSLWPSLARVVTDPGWRLSKMASLGPGARRLLRKVERGGSLRIERPDKIGAIELVRALLVHSGSIHTGKGSHATVVTSWEKVFDAVTRRRAGRLSIEQARVPVCL
jgi:hypothetical protein